MTRFLINYTNENLLGVIKIAFFFNPRIQKRFFTKKYYTFKKYNKISVYVLCVIL